MTDVVKPNNQRRYEKIRRLCRQLNRNRRILRDKVDLLCADLVQSNVALTQTVNDLRGAFEFQSELTGEFDLHYMLYKALRLIRHKVYESSAAVYLVGEGGFSAHLTSAWYNDPADISDLEQCFLQGIIPMVVHAQRYILLAEASQWLGIEGTIRQKLAGLSLLAVPIFEQDQLQGVLVLYRDAQRPLAQNDRRTVEPLLGPLARSTSSVRKLQQTLVPG